ncbi:helix-turn-helix domain-containing protein [Tumebacillus sp. ITR2]|uniref:Helix-turn-helix domain-containing protein n=1 Tax=Tumebacillus amylolyticus TaxID=2801339 RepID=A0ABS1J6L8_9BACL|nr:helix-turn-helix domain-containing protein [Tumebacillus amylolyticus]MBL0385930.1 helix-turn-helix domain-containing protein [Tumebacillus amylolyticus]
MTDTQELMHYIGENLKKYRLQKSMRQEELCEGLCSVSQLSKIENGKAQVKAEHLKIMAGRLGVEVEQLMSTDAIHDELRDQIELTRKATIARNYKLAFETIRSVLVRAKQAGYQDLYAEAVLFECYLLNLAEHNHQAALQKLRETLHDGGEFDPVTRAALQIEYGRAYSYTGDLVEGFRQYLQADTLLQRVEPVDDDLYARVLYRSAECMFYMQNWRTGYRYSEQAARVAETLGKHQYLTRAKSMQAAFADKLGRPDEARNLYEELLQDAENNNLILDIGTTENCLGRWYLDHGDLETAYHYLQRSLTSFDLLNDNYNLRQPLMDLAEWAQKAKQFEWSLHYADRVLELIREGGMPGLNELLQGQMLAINAKTYGELQDDERMISHYEQALELFDRNRAVIPAYEVCVTLADLYYGRDNGRALTLYKQAVGYNRIIHELGVKK